MRRPILLLILGSCFAAASARAQSTPTPAQQIVTHLATVLVEDMRTGVLNPTVPGPNAPAWIVAVRSIDSASANGLRTAVLRAMGGRASTAADTAAEHLSIEGIDAHGDTAFVSIDRGRLRCARGVPSGVGMIYRYTLVRTDTAWHVRTRKGDIIYDPPPTPSEPVHNSDCARAFAG